MLNYRAILLALLELPFDATLPEIESAALLFAQLAELDSQRSPAHQPEGGPLQTLASQSPRVPLDRHAIKRECHKLRVDEAGENLLTMERKLESLTAEESIRTQLGISKEDWDKYSEK